MPHRLMQQGEKVLIAVVEAIRKFCQIKMHKLLRHSAIHVEPMFGVTPKAFDAEDVVTPTRDTVSLSGE